MKFAKKNEIREKNEIRKKNYEKYNSNKMSKQQTYINITESNWKQVLNNTTMSINKKYDGAKGKSKSVVFLGYNGNFGVSFRLGSKDNPVRAIGGVNHPYEQIDPTTKKVKVYDQKANSKRSVPISVNNQRHYIDFLDGLHQKITTFIAPHIVKWNILKKSQQKQYDKILKNREFSELSKEEKDDIVTLIEDNEIVKGCIKRKEDINNDHALIRTKINLFKDKNKSWSKAAMLRTITLKENEKPRVKNCDENEILNTIVGKPFNCIAYCKIGSVSLINGLLYSTIYVNGIYKIIEDKSNEKKEINDDMADILGDYVDDDKETNSGTKRKKEQLGGSEHVKKQKIKKEPEPEPEFKTELDDDDEYEELSD